MAAADMVRGDDRAVDGGVGELKWGKRRGTMGRVCGTQRDAVEREWGGDLVRPGRGVGGWVRHSRWMGEREGPRGGEDAKSQHTRGEEIVDRSWEVVWTVDVGKREHSIAQPNRATYLGTTARGGDLHCFWSSWWPAEYDGAKIKRRLREPQGNTHRQSVSLVRPRQAGTVVVPVGAAHAQIPFSSSIAENYEIEARGWYNPWRKLREAGARTLFFLGRTEMLTRNSDWLPDYKSSELPYVLTKDNRDCGERERERVTGEGRNAVTSSRLWELQEFNKTTYAVNEGISFSQRRLGQVEGEFPRSRHTATMTNKTESQISLARNGVHYTGLRLQALNIEFYPAEDGGRRKSWRSVGNGAQRGRSGYGGRNVKAHGFSCAYGTASGSQRASGSSHWSAEHRFGCQNGGTPRGTARSEAQQGGRQTVERACPVTSPRRSLPRWNWGWRGRWEDADVRAQGCAVGLRKLVRIATQGVYDCAPLSQLAPPDILRIGSSAKDCPSSWKAYGGSTTAEMWESCDNRCVRLRTFPKDEPVLYRSAGSNRGTEPETVRVPGGGYTRTTAVHAIIRGSIKGREMQIGRKWKGRRAHCEVCARTRSGPGRRAGRDGAGQLERRARRRGPGGGGRRGGERRGLREEDDVCKCQVGKTKARRCRDRRLWPNSRTQTRRVDGAQVLANELPRLARGVTIGVLEGAEGVLANLPLFGEAAVRGGYVPAILRERIFTTCTGHLFPVSVHKWISMKFADAVLNPVHVEKIIVSGFILQVQVHPPNNAMKSDPAQLSLVLLQIKYR
ncbi:hypothetical protein DFH09DRAFT_1099851 [Mycena vulgaris]|nr:hypothetical protein DFH09DRAFT_1099851 [Mycena vulgaris]